LKTPLLLSTTVALSVRKQQALKSAGLYVNKLACGRDATHLKDTVIFNTNLPCQLRNSRPSKMTPFSYTNHCRKIQPNSFFAQKSCHFWTGKEAIL